MAGQDVRVRVAVVVPGANTHDGGRGAQGVQWNEMMAPSLFSILPVLIVSFLAQNTLIGGIASVGLKG